MNKKLALVIIALFTACSTADIRPHYVLKVCSLERCNILDIYDSLSYCIEMRDKLGNNAAAICEGFKEPY
jgi:hypothetical protein